jgi:predicted ArsR family transcriptional regulator
MDRGSDRFLLLLKTKGAQTSSELGRALGITDEAARQQLVKLAKEGLVEATSIAIGVGRPSQTWRLTAIGHSRFPDAHADLTVQLLQSIRTELGEEALERLISAREQATQANYSSEMAGSTDLGCRVRKLAEIRTREGYMAEWWEEGSDFMLVENHCPICAAATQCQGFCRAELAVFQKVLGPGATVTRVEHIPAGARRCAYRISRSDARGDL